MKSRSFLKLFALPLIFLSCFFISSVSAQEGGPPSVYLEMACFDFNTPDAEKFFVDHAKPFHEELIRKGVIVDWALMKVQFPNGSDCDCEYREVRVFTDVAALDFFADDQKVYKLASEVFKDQSLEELMQAFESKVEFNSSQVYVLQNELIPGPVEGGIMVVNFMDVAEYNSFEYMGLEVETFKPLHEHSNKNGGILDWSLWQRLYPYGTEGGGQYITMDVWKSFAHMNKLPLGTYWNKVHPDKKMYQVMTQISKIRDLRTAEIWTKVSRAEAEKMEEEPGGKK